MQYLLILPLLVFSGLHLYFYHVESLVYPKLSKIFLSVLEQYKILIHDMFNPRAWHFVDIPCALWQCSHSPIHSVFFSKFLNSLPALILLATAWLAKVDFIFSRNIFTFSLAANCSASSPDKDNLMYATALQFFLSHFLESFSLSPFAYFGMTESTFLKLDTAFIFKLHIK